MGRVGEMWFVWMYVCGSCYHETKNPRLHVHARTHRRERLHHRRGLLAVDVQHRLAPARGARRQQPRELAVIASGLLRPRVPIPLPYHGRHVVVAPLAIDGDRLRARGAPAGGGRGLDGRRVVLYVYMMLRERCWSVS